MKIDQLLYFAETARQEHVGKAAKILSISPSAVSHSIAALEDELGIELFEKHGKNIRLTSRGRILLNRVDGLMNQLKTIRDEVSAKKITLKGFYRIGATHVVCDQFVAPAFSELQNKNPELKGEVVTLRSAQVLASLLSGDIDVGFCLSPQQHPQLEMTTIYSGQLELVVRKSHPLLKDRKSDWIKKISDYPATLPKALQGIEICDQHPALMKNKIDAQPTLTYDSYGTALGKIKHSDAWSLVPDFFTKIHKNSVVALNAVANWDAPYTLRVVTLKNRNHSELRQPLAELVQIEVRRALKI